MCVEPFYRLARIPITALASLARESPGEQSASRRRSSFSSASVVSALKYRSIKLCNSLVVIVPINVSDCFTCACHYKPGICRCYIILLRYIFETPFVAVTSEKYHSVAFRQSFCSKNFHSADIYLQFLLLMNCQYPEVLCCHLSNRLDGHCDVGACLCSNF